MILANEQVEGRELNEVPSLAKPLVSIIINNHNYGRFLGDCVASALSQTYSNVEVIVVDDGSTDESKSVIESFGPKICGIFKPNGGQGSAYNAGFRASRGELIHFLDSDDMLEPAAIKEAVRVWQPGVSKVHFYLKVVEGNEARPTDTLIPSGPLGSGDLRSDILRTGFYNSPPASGNLYARKALAEILPMPESPWVQGADHFLIHLAPLVGEVRSLNSALGLYRVHGNNYDGKLKVTGEVLRYRLSKEVKRDALFATFCGEHGLTYQVGSVKNNIAHLKLRLASKVLDPLRHPFQEDTRYSLVADAIRLSWRDPGASISKKIFFSVWIACVAVSPKSFRGKLMEIGFVPAGRPRLFRKLVRSPARTESSPAK